MRKIARSDRGSISVIAHPEERRLATLTVLRPITYSPAPAPRRRFVAGAALGAASLMLWGCGRSDRLLAPALEPGATVLALGDSLTAGYGAGLERAWPAVLSTLSGRRIVNMGVNGDTTAGGLRRLQDELASRAAQGAGTMPAAIIIALGGNDMLRSVNEQSTVNNLAAAVRLARGVVQHQHHVALMATPRPAISAALGASLSDADFYARLGEELNLIVIEDLYSKVLSRSDLRSDRIHANAAGYAQIARGIHERLGRAGWW